MTDFREEYALFESDAVFAERFGVPVEPGWIGFPVALPFVLAGP